MNFFPEIELDHAAAEALARGLYAVAQVDGVHERERALIASFWADTGGGPQALAELERGQRVTGAALAAALSTEKERHLFVKSALLLALADGKVSSQERAIIAEFSTALGLAQPAIDRLEAEVKDFLLQQLSHLQNVDATRQVAKKLNV